MPRSPAAAQDAIEVEVVEIDGVIPPTSANATDESRGSNASWSDWQKWPGHVRKLDARWWPLWVVLGVVALGFVLTIGVVLGAIFIVARIIRNVLLGFASLFNSNIGATELRR